MKKKNEIFKEIFEDIKKDFGNLTSFKYEGNTLEISTPFLSINNDYISVFIKKEDDYYYISDGGWLETEIYTLGLNKFVYIDILKERLDIYSEKTNDINYYYVYTNNKKVITAEIYKIARFIEWVILLNMIK